MQTARDLIGNDAQMAAAFQTSAAIRPTGPGPCPRCGRPGGADNCRCTQPAKPDTGPPQPWRFRFYKKGLLAGTIYIKMGAWQAFRSISGSLFLWGWKWAWDLSVAARTVCSRTLPAEAVRERHGACQQCPALTIVRGRAYCGECPCPHWPPARLTYKNRKAGWNCPIGRQPGSVAVQQCASCGKV